MGILSQKIDALMSEANDCDMISSLSANPETRRDNRERAAKLRELAQRARQVQQVSKHASTSETDLSNRG